MYGPKGVKPKDIYDCLNRERNGRAKCMSSERVSPYKLLWDGILRHISEFVQEGTTLEVKIQAVSKAELLLTLEGVWLCAERVLDGASALFEACKGLLADFLRKTKG